jgi:hypothetical protein
VVSPAGPVNHLFMGSLHFKLREGILGQSVKPLRNIVWSSTYLDVRLIVKDRFRDSILESLCDAVRGYDHV